jgi:CRP-like cAMP-binding protein
MLPWTALQGTDQIEEIYGEDEPSDYVYQVITGLVRNYKLLSDGRRQIGAFYLPGDIFGLELGTVHRLTAEAIVDTTVRLVKRRSLAVKVANSLWAMTVGQLRTFRFSRRDAEAVVNYLKFIQRQKKSK